MNKGLRHTFTRYIATLMCAFAYISGATAGGDSPNVKYSNKAPLRMVCENEFYPFEYRNEDGNLEGFDIKVASRILGTLNVPYTISMTTRTEVNKIFDTNNADLIAKAPTNPIPGVYYTKNKFMIAYPKGKTPIKRLADLKHNDIVIFKEGSYCSEYVQANHLIRPEQMMYRTVKQGLLGIATGDYQYMICGEITMKTAMKRFNITNVEYSEIDIPDGAIRFCSRDKCWNCNRAVSSTGCSTSLCRPPP